MTGKEQRVQRKFSFPKNVTQSFRTLYFDYHFGLEKSKFLEEPLHAQKKDWFTGRFI